MCDLYGGDYRFTSPRIRAEREVQSLLQEVEFWQGRIGRLISSIALLRLDEKRDNAEKRLAVAQAKLTAFTSV